MKAKKILTEEVTPISVSSLPTYPTAPSGLGGVGYTSQDISIALKGLDMETLSLEEIIRQALKRMVR